MAHQTLANELDQLELFDSSPKNRAVEQAGVRASKGDSIAVSAELSSTLKGERKKRLGQYFSGEKVASLLAGLANVENAQNILDPMAGSGDMLLAAADLMHSTSDANATLAAIEIDPLASEICQTRLRDYSTFSIVKHSDLNQQLVCGSAFDLSSWNGWKDAAWDVVITNPPYVRYQNQNVHREAELDIPDREEVKVGLSAVLRSFTFLPEHERRLILQLASVYSGLSDLAVPSWLLCAAAVRPDGVLAMVLPESWLNREYAFLVHYLLLRWFDIEAIVEDTHAVWFDEAQVKTTLLIARRIPQRALPTHNESGYAYCRLTRSCMGAGSLVGGLFEDDSTNHLDRFVRELRTWRGKDLESEEMDLASRVEAHGGSLEWRLLQNDAIHLQSVLHKKNWFTAVESFERPEEHSNYVASYSPESNSVVLPTALREELNRCSIAYPDDSMTLTEMGIEVGQGHRTGANLFFHADLVRLDGDEVVVRGAAKFGGVLLRLPKDSALPVLRKQSELPLPFVVDEEALTGRVLTLHRFALPEDQATSTLTQQHYDSFSSDVADYVGSVAQSNLGTPESPRFVPTLSAVAPNSRTGSETVVPRFWYHLPDYAPRHRPDLLVARINHRSPRFYLNRDRGALIDANFSTLWRSSEVDSTPSLEAVLALCNSTWAAVFMESTGAVFGGGALKVEAAHLKRLVFPVPPPEERATFWKVMDEYGRLLVNAHREQETQPVIQQIDAQIGTLLSAKAKNKKRNRLLVEESVQALRALHQDQLARRNRQHAKTKATNNSQILTDANP